MSIKIYIDPEELRRKVEEKLQGFYERPYQLLGETLIREIDKAVIHKFRTGVQFPNEAAHAGYARSTKKERRRLGFQTSFVDFKRHWRRLEDTVLSKSDEHTHTIRYRSNKERGRTAGQIFYFHHYGLGNNPLRRIFPTRANQISHEIRAKARTAAAKQFNEYGR